MIAADYVLPGGRYRICEVSEKFHWRGKPGLIWADCWTLEEARATLARATSDSVWMRVFENGNPTSQKREGVVLGVWDGMKWIDVGLE